MISEIKTFVTAHSDNSQVIQRLKELLSPREGKSETSAIDIINNVYNTSYCYEGEKEDYNKEVDFPPYELWNNMIGSEWLFVDFEESDTVEDCYILIRCADVVPIELIEFLKYELQEVDKNCYLTATYAGTLVSS